MAARKAATRPYLREADRRRHLLDATATLVGHRGIEAVTMSALAREAGVSRRLVYDHFEDLATLFEAFLDDRVQRYGALFDATIATSPDPSGRAVAMFGQALALPREELRIARMLVAGTGGAELDRARAHFRRHVIGRWFDDEEISIHDPDAALVWTMAAAVLTTADLVVRGELGEDAGIRIVRALVAGVGTRTTPT